MYVQASSNQGDAELDMPSFLKDLIVQEVTGESEFSSRAISTRGGGSRNVKQYSPSRRR
jgi:hypothetical protein